MTKPEVEPDLNTGQVLLIQADTAACDGSPSPLQQSPRPSLTILSISDVPQSSDGEPHRTLPVSGTIVCGKYTCCIVQIGRWSERGRRGVTTYMQGSHLPNKLSCGLESILQVTLIDDIDVLERFR
ncbi:hypothetical protein P691DRAFT_126671 [Macrolepiota fuliginosa MF-IS2]|uniref:Uncharacterized protein n=1 Tax=Macrolepiota fuliginosa MF-IS2 TaxID=1400762 RepID=A0A9P6BWB1_9AGAR|nr:hypothetical protein P691DRAFT_126671 [Macrolepiota fuliginosa MF-IS2]